MSPFFKLAPSHHSEEYVQRTLAIAYLISTVVVPSSVTENGYDRSPEGPDTIS